MAATLFRAPIAPVPTPISTAFNSQGPFPRFARRFENSTLTTAAPGPDCSKFNGFETCSSNGDYGNCLSGNEAAFCNCNNGVQYLDCVSAAITASTCVGAVGIADWDAYERSWFQSSCPTPPSSVMSLLPQPTSVQLDLQTIVTIIPSGPIAQPPPPTATPNFRDGGELLVGDCQSTAYTLLNGGDMVFYAALVGCNGDRPECCPWNITAAAPPGTPDDGRAAAEAGDFPVPAADAKDRLDRCPGDYYSVSGQCCPNGYYKFTRQIASQTPCFSSLPRDAARPTPPPITVGMPANPTDTSLPTSAVVNLAWAMGFQVEDEPAPPALSKAAVVGIGIGSGVAAVAVVAALAMVVLRWRRRRRAAAAAREDDQFSGGGGFGGGGMGDMQQQGMTYHPGYHAPPGESGLLSPAEVKPAYGANGGGGWGRGGGYHQAPQPGVYERY